MHIRIYACMHWPFKHICISVHTWKYAICFDGLMDKLESEKTKETIVEKVENE